MYMQKKIGQRVWIPAKGKYKANMNWRRGRILKLSPCGKYAISVALIDGTIVNNPDYSYEFLER